MRYFTLVFSTFCLLLAGLTAVAAPPAVKVVQLAAGSLVPDALVDAKGVLHLVVGIKNDAYYLQSIDNGATFSKPLKLNGPEGVTTTMGERGPKLALGEEGSIHVIWADRWKPGAHVLARYTQSLDGGKTFTTPRAISAVWGFDGLTFAVDNAGNVLVFWHINDERKPVEGEATWLYLTRSTDNGITFSKPERLQITGHNGLACSMCQMRAVINNGQVMLAFRSAASDIRDFYVLTSKVAENAFTTVRVNTDNWKIDYCPMNGPELTLGPDGRAYCAFMTANKVYWAVSDAKVSAFTNHVATPANETDEIYPTAVANRKGDVLFLWQVGPMSTSGKAVVKWARYGADGKATGEQGTAGTSFSGTKATAVVGADDNFYLLTTAK
ncbi:MAG: sialidase family protein [bacterium]